jgi:hypothetical protein
MSRGRGPESLYLNNMGVFAPTQMEDFTPSAGLMDMGMQPLSAQQQVQAVPQAELPELSEPPLETMEQVFGDQQPRRTLGLLGDMFGGASALDEYLKPQQKAQLQDQGLMAAAMQLLAASGPSRTPVGLGQALGQAYGAGQQGYTAAQQNLLQSMTMKQKMDEAKATKGMQATVSTFLAQKAPEGVDAKEFKAQQYMKLADVYAATNPEQASKFFDMAQKLTPARAKVSGQPFEVAGTDGKPILVQQDEFGDIRTIGYGPKKKVVLQNVDGVVTAIDESALKGGEKFGTGVSKVEQARMDLDQAKLKIEQDQLKIAQQRLGLSQEEFNRGVYERVQNEDGVFYVSKIPGKPVIPILGPGGVPLKGAAASGKPTEAEQNASGFAQRMERVTGIIDALPVAAAPGMGSAIAGAIPLVGGVAQRGVQSEQTQQFQQAANDWIRAKLRKESGAAIGKDEMESEYRTYFPQVGDGPAVIAQKADARRIATEAMKTSAGKSYRPYAPTVPAAGGADVRSQADRILSGGK